MDDELGCCTGKALCCKYSGTIETRSGFADMDMDWSDWAANYTQHLFFFVSNHPHSISPPSLPAATVPLCTLIVPPAIFGCRLLITIRR